MKKRLPSDLNLQEDYKQAKRITGIQSVRPKRKIKASYNFDRSQKTSQKYGFNMLIINAIENSTLTLSNTRETNGSQRKQGRTHQSTQKICLKHLARSKLIYKLVIVLA